MTRTSRSGFATLSLAAFLVAIFAASGCASRTRGPEPAASLETAPSRFATVDETRVHYESVGSGREAIVLVHGWSGDVSVWRFQVLMLEKPQEFNAAVLDFLQKQKLLGG